MNQRTLLHSILVLGVVLPGLVLGGGAELGLDDVEGVVGEITSTTLTLETSPGELAGWQIAVCHDDLFLTIPESGVSSLPLVTDLEPLFEGIQVLEDNWSVGAIVSADGQTALDGTGDLYEVNYELLAVGDSSLEFCVEGLDPEEILLVLEDESVSPATNPASVTISSAETFELVETSLPYDPATGEGSGSVEIRISDAIGTPSTSFQVALAYDDDFMILDGVRAIGPLAEVNDGDGPEFLVANLEPVGGPGCTVGVYYSLSDVDLVLTFSAAGDRVLALDFVTVAENESFDGSEVVTEVRFEDGLGDPPIDNAIVFIDESYPNLLSTDVYWREQETTPFLRGDIDNDGEVFSILEALYVLEFAFIGGPAPVCADAADVDDDGSVFAILDALFLLDWNFLGGEVPPAPGPDECGVDVTPDALDCAETECP